MKKYLRARLRTVYLYTGTSIIVTMVTEILTFVLRAASLRHCWAGTATSSPLTTNPPRRTEAGRGRRRSTQRHHIWSVPAATQCSRCFMSNQLPGCYLPYEADGYVVLGTVEPAAKFNHTTFVWKLAVAFVGQLSLNALVDSISVMRLRFPTAFKKFKCEWYILNSK